MQARRRSWFQLSRTPCKTCRTSSAFHLSEVQSVIKSSQLQFLKLSSSRMPTYRPVQSMIRDSMMPPRFLLQIKYGSIMPFAQRYFLRLFLACPIIHNRFRKSGHLFSRCWSLQRTDVASEHTTSGEDVYSSVPRSIFLRISLASKGQEVTRNPKTELLKRNYSIGA